MTGHSDTLRWRFEVDAPPVDRAPTSPSQEQDVGTSWQHLLVMHTVFRATDLADHQKLVAQLRDIERLFIQNPDLEPYYRESFMGEDGAPMSDEVRGRASHVASLQADLMEEIFFVLQLDRYANAPDNRGWMNLMRRWGNSRILNHRLDLLRTTYSEAWLEFYDLYVRGYLATIDRAPVPHPWDGDERRRDSRSKVPSEPGAGDLLPGAFLDSGIREVARSRASRRSGERPLEKPGTGQHGSPKDEPVAAPDTEPDSPPRTPPNA